MGNTNDLKRCSSCGIDSLKSNFHKDRKRKDGLRPQCIDCRKKFHIKNLDKIKIYYLENRDKLITQQREYKNNKYKTDISFRLNCITRSRIRQALYRKTKSISTKEILGRDIDLYKNGLNFNFTPEMIWNNFDIDHVKPICLFDISKDDELREAFNWKNIQLLLKHDHQRKVSNLIS